MQPFVQDRTGDKRYLDCALSFFFCFRVLNFASDLCFAASNPPVPLLGDLTLVRSLLRGSPLYWGHFSPKRVLRSVAYYSSGFSQNDRVEVEADDDAEERERSRS